MPEIISMLLLSLKLLDGRNIYLTGHFCENVLDFNLFFNMILMKVC